MFHIAFCIGLVATIPGLAPIRAADDTPVAFPGAVLLHGDGTLTGDTLDAFVRRAGGERAKLVVVGGDRDTGVEFWRRRGLADVGYIAAAPRGGGGAAAANKLLEVASAAWVNELSDPSQSISAVFGRGGIIGGHPKQIALLGLLPSTIIETGLAEGVRKFDFAEAPALRPGKVGYSIDHNTALLIDRRQITVTGTGTVRAVLAASRSKARRTYKVTWRAGLRGDHVALRRAALDRATDDYPPAKFPPAELQSGTVVIVGGGGTPRSAIETFIAAAGGKKARIVVINTALGDRPPKTAANLKSFHALGATNLRLVHAESRQVAGEDSFVAEIDAAGGVWFTGGRQWRLVDRYLGTPTEDAIRRLLKRGGAVGGTSAGATICGDYLTRGHPLSNHIMMAEGYQRGLALVPGLAVDQHFRQRNRLPDLLAVKRRYPQLLPIGIDESTAAIISGSTLAVVGRGAITILDQPLPATPRLRAGEHFSLVKSGQRYNMKERRLLPDSVDPSEE